MVSRPTSDDATNGERPAAQPPSRRSVRVARFLSIVGYILISLWGLTCLVALLLFATLLCGGTGGGPGWGGIGAGMAIGALVTVCATVSCTLLPLGVTSLFAARMLRRGGRQEKFGRLWVLAVGIFLVGVGVLSFARQLSSPAPIPDLLVGALCLIGAAIIFIALQRKRGALAAVVLIIVPVAVTAFDVQRERARRMRLEAEVIHCDVDLRWGGGVAMTSTGDIIALGVDADSRPVVAQWDFLSGRHLGTDRLPQERLPQQLERSRWDVSRHGSILAMPMAVYGKGREDGLFIYDYISKEERFFRNDKEEYFTLDSHCCTLRLSPHGDSCAIGYGRHGTVKLWDLASGHCRTWSVSEDNVETVRFAFDPEGALLAISFKPRGSKESSPRLGIWSLDEASPRLVWCVDIAEVLEMRMSADPARLNVVTGGRKTNLELLHVATATGEIISRHALGGPIDAWHPGGCAMSTAADRLVIFRESGGEIRESSAEIWDVNSVDREGTMSLGRNRRFSYSAVHVDQMRFVMAVLPPRGRYIQFRRPTGFTQRWIRRWDLAQASPPN